MPLGSIRVLKPQNRYGSLTPKRSLVRIQSCFEVRLRDCGRLALLLRYLTLIAVGTEN